MPQPQPIKGKLPITSTNEVKLPRRTVLAWGPPKSGKTHFACSWPNPFIIQWDHNMATLLKHEGVPFIIPESMKQYDTLIVPAIQNRKLTELVREMDGFSSYTVETLIEDSLTLKGRALKDDISNNGKMEMGYAGWGTYLNRFSQWTKILTQAARPLVAAPDRETYNYVATIHEKYILSDEGALLKITTSIEGQYADIVLQEFDSVFAMDAKTEWVEQKGKPRTRATRRFMHTVPPDRFRKVGDGVGGKRYKVLPPTLENTYPVLAEAWGLDNEK